ncbi:PLDc N-terminal domain-containing protein [Rhodococcoides yunnanense]|uniref:PLDc N-terminal domain-containing protein n=1 Tax=Rhodococcoides yunnanense TaxID=278209 RepID=UPI0009345565|nr:PLDc N-terminal domain-containing protein [Rhodococcus yunnanensis]
MTFWETLGWMLSATVFIGYLFALFAIITDLFRDHKLNGWLKAIWVFFLLFLPIVTALVYLVARAEGMTERSRKAAREAESAAESYIREVAGKGPSEEIATAAALLDAGAITADEYAALKLKVLS